MDCNGCGQCCENMVMKDYEYAVIVKKHPEIQGLFVEFAGNFMINGRCPLLDDDNKCTVYEDRPLVCRCYPVVVDLFDFENKVTIGENCPKKDTITTRDIEIAKVRFKIQNDEYKAKLSRMYKTPREFYEMINKFNQSKKEW